jgi:hypothetical protein
VIPCKALFVRLPLWRGNSVIEEMPDNRQRSSSPSSRSCLLVRSPGRRARRRRRTWHARRRKSRIADIGLNRRNAASCWSHRGFSRLWSGRQSRPSSFPDARGEEGARWGTEINLRISSGFLSRSVVQPVGERRAFRNGSSRIDGSSLWVR